MARAQGARAQMALAFETVYGTAPASGYTRVPFASTSLGSEQPLIASELLGYLPHLAVRGPVAATLPHVRVRQVLGSPTTAKALTPAGAAERDRKTAARHLRDLQSYVSLRARELRRSGPGPDLLVVGQKAAIDALRAAGLPARVDAVHFNGLSASIVGVESPGSSCSAGPVRRQRHDADCGGADRAGRSDARARPEVCRRGRRALAGRNRAGCHARR
jgi:hypothetical protein